MLILNDNVREALLSHAEREYPHECCGVLLGLRADGKRIAERAVRLENKSGSDKTVRFAVDPLDIPRIEKTAFAEGREIVGFYHSHPNRAAVLSKTDERYMLEDCSYPVVSVNEGAGGMVFKIASFEKMIGTSICSEEQISESEK
ncbi:MAG: M67 family metallopeptidase [Bacteroides sp.]|nr:M67 family metallopeptidase [Eubacterium sp.]MCM1418202.1 M67 family metallopeptidase [Roseburia sp.]MCM1462753.1 M67 family metallopeptidase [Bacteroides sp.]